MRGWTGRFIPARAGNSEPKVGSRWGHAVHPRTRGELPQPAITAEDFCGSSPHARGTRPQAQPRTPQRRFIPARAGNSREPVCRNPPRTVHPRTRGELMPPRWPSSRAAGSSPHARGTRNSRQCGPASSRFIPARAGNSAAARDAAEAAAVHPRTRGELSPRASPHRRRAGSSPHARGTRTTTCSPTAATRFIPARAGNSGVRRSWRAQDAVHPRTRGELGPVRRAALDGDGSSPHARGTLKKQAAPHLRKRFIPARAGNSTAQARAPPPRTVHPRTRGELLFLLAIPLTPYGSSPHARGTHAASPA